MSSFSLLVLTAVALFAGGDAQTCDASGPAATFDGYTEETTTICAAELDSETQATAVECTTECNTRGWDCVGFNYYADDNTCWFCQKYLDIPRPDAFTGQTYFKDAVKRCTTLFNWIQIASTNKYLVNNMVLKNQAEAKSICEAIPAPDGVDGGMAAHLPRANTAEEVTATYSPALLQGTGEIWLDFIIPGDNANAPTFSDGTTTPAVGGPDFLLSSYGQSPSGCGVANANVNSWHTRTCESYYAQTVCMQTDPIRNPDGSNCVSWVEDTANGRIYHIAKAEKTREEARAYCQGLGADLASFRTQAEMNWARTAFAISDDDLDEVYFWTGLKGDGSGDAGSVKNADGSDVGFAYVVTGDASYLCLMVRHSQTSDAELDYTHCDEKGPTLCAKPFYPFHRATETPAEDPLP